MSYYAGQLPHGSPDGRRVLVASSVNGNYDIMAIDTESLESNWVVCSEKDESNAQWSPDGSEIAYVVNDRGNLVIRVKNLASGYTRRMSPADGLSGVIGMRGKGGDFRWTAGGEGIVFSYAGPKDPGSIWLAPSSRGQARCLYRSLPETVDASTLVAPEIVEYPARDGLSISAFLYRPRVRSERSAGIVLPHGGPTGQSQNGWSSLIQVLVANGYVVMEPNFRGSTGYGRDFQWMNRNDWGGADLEDVVAGADWLEARGIAEGLGIMGGSYGGFMTLSAITRFPRRWKAAVSLYGISNLVTMYETAREDMKLFQERNIGRPDENPRFYYDRSPINFVDKVECPVLILQGDRDPRVLLRESLAMKQLLEDQGKSVEYVEYEDEGHGFSRLETRLDYIQRILRFFGRYLPTT
jgi:dipeptidyl aminopeptidase/acylaminoacyl peptidase